MEEFKSNLPFLHLILSRSLTTKNGRHKTQIQDGQIGHLVPGLGIIIAMVAKMRTGRFKLIPALLGMSMYKNGCSAMLLNALSKTGLCHTSGTVRNIIDRYGVRYDQDIQAAKTEMEAKILHDTTKVIQLPPEETLDHSVGLPEWSFLTEDNPYDKTQGWVTPATV
ncbi:uncharacterized protein LOC119726752 [Patiria miniata]|uniref:Uncharacterized protein n=1 Tax=Patiria miniata TaxID=46514 RepID=A0A913ZSB5_PATMI|nr:uncharacterized protein LOC119726752 [Patiria miniata]